MLQGLVRRWGEAVKGSWIVQALISSLHATFPDLVWPICASRYLGNRKEQREYAWRFQCKLIPQPIRLS